MAFDETQDANSGVSVECHISTFRDVFDTAAQHRDLSLADLGELVRTAPPAASVDDKDQRCMLSFARYDGRGIGAANVLAYHGIALDFDEGHRATFDGLADATRLDGWHAVLHTSRKHLYRNRGPRLRLLLPFLRSASMDEAMQLGAFLAEAVGGGVASESFARSQRFWYSPVAGREDVRCVAVIEGERFADEWARANGFIYNPAPPASSLDLVSLEDRRKEWLKKKDRIRDAALLVAPTLVDRQNKDGGGLLQELLFPLHDITGGQPDGWDLFVEAEALSGRRARMISEGRHGEVARMLSRYRADWRGATRREERRPDMPKRAIGSLLEAAKAVRAAAWLDDLADLDDAAPAPFDDFDVLLGLAEPVDLGPIDRPEAVDPGINPDKNWTRLLDVTDEGEVRNGPHNLATIVANDERLFGRLGYNLHLQSKVFIREPAPLRKKARDGKPILQLDGPIWRLDEPRQEIDGKRWTDDHDAALRRVLDAPKNRGGYGVKVAQTDLAEAIRNTANANIFHPIRDRLMSLKWDGVSRRSGLFIDYLGCPDDEYHREAANMFTLGAVARVFRPGCKFDFVPILEGPQGTRKSTFIKILGLDWGAELNLDFHDNNKIIEALQGVWIGEIPELQGFPKAEATQLKAVISRTHDKGRLAWERNVREFPRQCVMIGSTNEDDYLRDVTGGRRFWVVKIGVESIDTDRLLGEIEQIWAEAMDAYLAFHEAKPRGDLPLFLTGAAAETAKMLQESRRSETPEELLAAEIAMKLEEPVSTDIEGVSVPREATCVKEVWIDLLGREAEKLDGSPAAARLMGKALRLAGWEPIGKTAWHPRYGAVKSFRRRG